MLRRRSQKHLKVSVGSYQLIIAHTLVRLHREKGLTLVFCFVCEVRGRL